MVLVDGHDPGWMTRFRSAIDDDKVDKLSFVHLNLNFVPWKEMLHIQPDYRNQHYYHGHETAMLSSPISIKKRKKKNQKKRWQSIEVIDCRKVESGLTHLLAAHLHVEHMYISSRHNTLSRQFGQIVGLGLIESKCLKKLHLSSCHWSEESMKEIISGLQSTCVLEELNLSFTTWNNNHRNHNNINNINHHHNHHGGGDNEEGNNNNNNNSSSNNNNNDDDDDLHILQHFASGLSQNTTIKVLKLNLCRLSDNQIAYLIKFGLMDHPCLEELYLGGNSLKKHSMEAISNLLLIGGSCNKVRTLDISNPLNHHHDHDPPPPSPQQQHYYQPILFRSLAQQQQQQQLLSSSSSSSSLRFLNLASNKLTDDHIDELILAVKESGITTLDLKSNQITDVGITKLAVNLPPQLEKLWLQGNPFGIVGARSLYTKIKQSHGHMIDLRIPTYNTLSPVPTLMKIQKDIRYYEALNRGGRQIILNQTKPVPLGLWPLILARVNKLNFENGYDFYDNLKLEVHYTLLHEGPVLFS